MGFSLFLDLVIVYSSYMYILYTSGIPQPEQCNLNMRYFPSCIVLLGIGSNYLGNRSNCPFLNI